MPTKISGISLKVGKGKKKNCSQIVKYVSCSTNQMCHDKLMPYIIYQNENYNMWLLRFN